MFTINTAPNEIVLFRPGGISSYRIKAKVPTTPAMMEFIRRFDRKEYPALLNITDTDAFEQSCHCTLCEDAAVTFEEQIGAYSIEITTFKSGGIIKGYNWQIQ